MAQQIDGWSVTQQFRKCGKLNCKTCAEGRGHGPYYVGTMTENGVRKSKYFGKLLPGELRPAQSKDTLPPELEIQLTVLQQENDELRQTVTRLRRQLDDVDPPRTELEMSKLAEAWSNQSTASLSELKNNMMESVQSGSSTTWTISLRQLEENIDLITKLLADREDVT